MAKTPPPPKNIPLQYAYYANGRWQDSRVPAYTPPPRFVEVADPSDPGSTIAVPASDPRATSPQIPQPAGITDSPNNYGYEVADPSDPGSTIARPGGPGFGTPVDEAAYNRSQQESLEERRRAEDRAREQRNAFVRLQSILDEYGLGTLSTQVQAWLQDGLSEAEITQRMRDTTEFKTRFPAIEARKKAGLPALSPGEYVAYERQMRQLMRAAGLPLGFYDSNDDFTGFLTRDISVAEMGDRITLAARAAFDTDAATRRELSRFGMGDGDLTAFFLDPDTAQPLLERRYNAARLSGRAVNAGFGGLSESEATDLVTLGVTDSQASEGFSQLGAQSEFFTPLDRGEDRIGRQEQLGAAFKADATAQRRIRQRQRRRQAAFEGGGGFASTQEGLAGLGAADQG